MSQQVVVVNFLCYDILVLEMLSKQQGLFTSVTQAPQGGGGGEGRGGVGNYRGKCFPIYWGENGIDQQHARR